MSTDHDRAFFEQMATCRDAYRRLGDAIHHTLGPPIGNGRVLDVGAGLGFVPARLAELGWKAVGSDPYAPQDLREQGCAWMPFQLLDVPWWPWPLFNRPDVVICTETAEHIHERAADTIVANVAGAAEHLIVWSAAQPGQEWPGHVNLQPPDYWLCKFSDQGFEVFRGATDVLRDEMLARHAQHEHGVGNFFVLARRP